MRCASLVLPAALALTALAPLVAHATPGREHRAEDHAYLEGAIHTGLTGGGAFDTAVIGGWRAALGVNLTPDLAVEAQVFGSGDPLGSGYASSGWSLGAAWFLTDSFRLGLSTRLREFRDDQGFAEALGRAIGEVIVGALVCGEDCAFATPAAFVADDIGLELVIASKWHWDVFTLGVEWFAIYTPLVLRDARYEVITDDGRRVTVDTDNVDARDMPMDMRFLSVSLGASF